MCNPVISILRRHGQRRPCGQISIGLLAASMLLLSQAAWAADDQWVALTLSRKGAWGTATDTSRARSIALAIHRCKQMSKRPSDCGALLKAVQRAWSLAVLCGDYNIVVTGPTLAEAEAAAQRRAAELRRHFAGDVPPCIHIVTVDPDGRVAVGEPLN
jgi:hypothetical protein